MEAGEITKKCTGPCGQEKPLSAFGPHKTSKYGRRPNCRECYSIQNSQWNRTRLYGITQEEFDALLEDQGGVCGICGGPPLPGENLCVDHDHAAEKVDGKVHVRGLLCKACNLGLGKLGDTEERLLKALEYLQRSLIKG